MSAELVIQGAPRNVNGQDANPANRAIQNNDTIVIGDTSGNAGDISVTNGGIISSTGGGIILGRQANSIGTVSISGRDTNQPGINPSQMHIQPAGGAGIIGDRGNGTLTLSDKGEAHFRSAGTSLIVGNQTGAIGTVSVSGTDSRLTATENVIIGNSASGNLMLRNGGTASLPYLIIGKEQSGNGQVTADGQNTELSADGVTIGDRGTGALILSNSARLLLANGQPATGITIAKDAGSTGSLAQGLVKLQPVLG